MKIKVFQWGHESIFSESFVCRQYYIIAQSGNLLLEDVDNDPKKSTTFNKQFWYSVEVEKD